VDVLGHQNVLLFVGLRDEQGFGTMIEDDRFWLSQVFGQIGLIDPTI